LSFDAAAGVPVANVDEFRVDLSGTLGWDAKRWGLRASADRRIYDSDRPGTSATEAALSVGGRGWFNFRDVDAFWGISVGAGFAVDQLLSDIVFYDEVDVRLSDELSQVVRGSFNLSAWLHPSERFVVRLSGAAGGHAEYYSRDEVQATGAASVSTTETEGSSGDYRGSVLMTYRVWPELLRVTLHGQAAHYQLTRSSGYFNYTEGENVSLVLATTTLARTEARGQLAVELEALAFGPVRPCVFGELTYVRMDDGSHPFEDEIPSIGVGLRSHLPN
jgi:hypothetical protein